MSLESHKNGSHVTLRCDVCGRRTRSLKKITGYWMNPKTKRKVANGAAWVCPACKARITKGGGRP